jgi:hypothetical protein
MLQDMFVIRVLNTLTVSYATFVTNMWNSMIQIGAQSAFTFAVISPRVTA